MKGCDIKVFPANVVKKEDIVHSAFYGPPNAGYFGTTWHVLPETPYFIEK